MRQWVRAAAQLWEEGVGREEGEVKAWGMGGKYTKAQEALVCRLFACCSGAAWKPGPSWGKKSVGKQEVGGRFQSSAGWMRAGESQRRPAVFQGPDGAGTS